MCGPGTSTIAGQIATNAAAAPTSRWVAAAPTAPASSRRDQGLHQRARAQVARPPAQQAAACRGQRRQKDHQRLRCAVDDGERRGARRAGDDERCCGRGGLRIGFGDPACHVLELERTVLRAVDDRHHRPHLAHVDGGGRHRRGHHGVTGADRGQRQHRPRRDDDGVELEPAVESRDSGLGHMSRLAVGEQHRGRSKQRVVAVGLIDVASHAVRIGLVGSSHAFA